MSTTTASASELTSEGVTSVMESGHGPVQRHRLAILSTEPCEATGVEPIVDTPTGSPAERIADSAARCGANLVVVGRRGLAGLRALGSVSERVVHAAPCSVLVIPTPR